MRSDSSNGADPIPANYLKLVADQIASALTHNIDSFISRKYFPAAWKIARISPIPKVNHPTDVDQYRPIAIVPALSKVYERLVPHQMVEHIDKHDVLQRNIMR